MRIDSHQHFWDYTTSAADYTWMNDELHVLRRNYLPPEYQTLIQSMGYDGSVAVQAREVKVETDFLLALANQYSFIKGVVGWLDLCSPNLEGELEEYNDSEKLKGLRMLIHDQPDPDFADSDAHATGVGSLAHHDLRYDLLLRTIHLPAAIRLVDRYPNQLFVVNHIAKPRFDGSDWSPWSSGIREIARRSNVYCKLSGMVTETDWRNWQSADYARYIEVAVGAFGIERCMIGSDWPVCTCVADYKGVMQLVQTWAEKLSEAEQAALFGGTCAEFYRLV